MKPTKTIDTKLDGRYDARFMLEFAEDENGEYAILTAPSVQWLSPTENKIILTIYKISGRVLECIEKQYFDNNIVSIPVKGESYPVMIENFLNEIITDETYEQMLAGTFEINDDADKSIYGNLPVKIKRSSAKKSNHPEKEVISSPYFDQMLENLGNMFPGEDEFIETVRKMLDGTYVPEDDDADESKAEQGKSRKKKKK